MNAKVSLVIIMFLSPTEIWATTVFNNLNLIPASRLDIAMQKLRLEAHEYEFRKLNESSLAYKFQFAVAAFHEQTQEVHISASIKPTDSVFTNDVLCHNQLSLLMGHFKFGEGKDHAGLFYAFYFMPEMAPPLTFEMPRHQEVYRNTIFTLSLVGDNGLPEGSCSYRGGDNRIIYKESDLGDSPS